jgi:RNA polymerase sigma-70 factor (ECF subfamily)
VGLADQDRTVWDRLLVAEAATLLRDSETPRPGKYRILSEINAVHASADDPSATDWRRIAALYGELERVEPSPIVHLNKAIAVSEAESPEAALAMVDRVAESLDGHRALHTVRAELLRRLGRDAEAAGAYDHAIARTANGAEIDYLTRRRDELTPHTNGDPE